MRMLTENAAPAARCLELVEEYKLPPLLGPEADGRWEASGVCAAEGQLYVIFDNTPQIARLLPPPSPGGPRPALIRQPGESMGDEDVAYDTGARRFHLLIEADAYRPGGFH